MPQSAGAEIGLLPLSDHLRQSRLRTVAVEDVGRAGHRWLVRGAAGKNIIVSDLRVEQRQDVAELGCRDGLRCRLAAGVEREAALLADGLLERTTGAVELAQHRLRDAQRGS